MPSDVADQEGSRFPFQTNMFCHSRGSDEEEQVCEIVWVVDRAIPVARAQDNLKPVDPAIRLWVPDYENDPTLVKLVSVEPERVPVEAR